MSYSYDTEPTSGSYSNDNESSSVLTWDQCLLRTWNQALSFTWASGGANFSYDIEPGLYSGAVIPEGTIGGTFIIRDENEAIYNYDEKP